MKDSQKKKKGISPESVSSDSQDENILPKIDWEKQLGKTFAPHVKAHINETLNSEQEKDDDTQFQKFPIEVFPNQIQEIIKDVNTALNFPVDFIGGSILFAASVAVG